eukprot:6138265-Amphidinium_carterae.1
MGRRRASTSRTSQVKKNSSKDITGINMGTLTKLSNKPGHNNKSTAQPSEDAIDIERRDDRGKAGHP